MSTDSLGVGPEMDMPMSNASSISGRHQPFLPHPFIRLQLNFEVGLVALTDLLDVVLVQYASSQQFN